jgi:hypothetical protein
VQLLLSLNNFVVVAVLLHKLTLVEPNSVLIGFKPIEIE